MLSFSDHIEEIKALITSNNTPNKSFGYSSLLHIQEQSSNDACSIQSLAGNSRCLIRLIVADIFDDEEEVAALALKCLGFMIYHPSLAATIRVNDANLVLEALSKLITSTKMKSVCNLGVWCISMQQLDPSFLAVQFHALLRAVVHALDNPIGSLSTTFEAMQAVIKLAAQLNEEMKDLSHIWAPPIYRRLLSIDKRERDMSERCLLKIKSTVIPPSRALSKAIIEDMKQKLLAGMKDLLNQSMKIQAIQAWGWFIRLLGSYAVKNRHLINDMLKIPEQTFTDQNPQVQIASQVAWEGLVDALVQPPIISIETDIVKENQNHRVQVFKEMSSDNLANPFAKSVKLIMTPLIGIISSKCDVSVYSSCFSTWCYLLHKLDTSVNHPSVVKLVLEPILEAVFKLGPNGKSIWFWNLCLDLLDDIILAKTKIVDYNSHGQASHHLSARSSVHGPSTSGDCSWKQHPIKWLPWDLSQLDFYLKMINIIISHALVATFTPECRNSVCVAVLRIFRSALRGVHMELRSSSVTYDERKLCVDKLLGFIKKLYEDVSSQTSCSDGLHHTCLHCIEAITEELEPLILGSPLYKVALDIKYIDIMQSGSEFKHTNFLGIDSVAPMDMVSPVVYLSVIYLCLVIRSTKITPETDFILQGLHKYISSIFSSYELLENLLATIGLLYNHLEFRCLQIWIAMANSLRDCTDGAKDVSTFTLESESYLAICHFLCYPFIVCSTGRFAEESLLPPWRKLALEHVVEVWKSLYGSFIKSKFEYFTTNSFAENLCSVLNGYLDESAGNLEQGAELNLWYKDQDRDFLSFFGDIVIYLLEKVHPSDVRLGLTTHEHDGDFKISSGMHNSLGFAARFMKLSWILIGGDQSIVLPLTSSCRVFSALARFCCHFNLKQNILLFSEIMSSPLLQWLSNVKILDESINRQLELLWAEALNCLQRSEPPIIFDDSFLELQAPLLALTLDHSNPSISKPTISFWNFTYGKQSKLDFPQNLLSVLDKLSRNGQISLHRKSHLPFLRKCDSLPEVSTASHRCMVTTMHNRSSKRVEFMEPRVNPNGQKDKLSSSLKRRKLELTEHQKEVRRAQQGRERDCNGHGPGIRTYTNLDFSQGNEDSQESQDIRNPETILEMLRRA